MKTETIPRALNDEDLNQMAGASACVDEIDLPLNEFRAFKTVDSNLVKQLMGSGWTKDRFYGEMVPGMKNASPEAISALLKVTGHAEWLSQGGPQGISG